MAASIKAMISHLSPTRVRHGCSFPVLGCVDTASRVVDYRKLTNFVNLFKYECILLRGQRGKSSGAQNLGVAPS